MFFWKKQYTSIVCRHISLILPLSTRKWKIILGKLVEILQGFVLLSLDKMASKRGIMGWTKIKT